MPEPATAAAATASALSWAFGSPLWWGTFNAVVIVLLLVDLVVFHREAHKVSTREAALWSAFWIALSLGFNLLLWRVTPGTEKGLEFFTGYLIEKALSIDNLFVFLMVFKYFHIKEEDQHRVLFWGIIGALVMRAAFIFTGVELLRRFEWVMYVFGLLLLFTGGKMLVGKDEGVEPEKNPVLRLVSRFIPTTTKFDGHKFFTIENGRRVATPLLVVLIVIESTDVVFALDSIPAILAISQDSFIVYSSNICAILGLRALYFLLSSIMSKFRYLKPALAAVLLFIGAKMVLSFKYHVPTIVSLGVIAIMLTVGILASVMAPEEDDEKK